MKTTLNTVLITGGSAGIGLEIAKQFSLHNKVIILGRNQERLDKAVASLPNVTGIRADVSNKEDVEALVNKLYAGYPELNVIVNNAGSANYNDLLVDTDTFEKAENEMQTNYLSVVRLNQYLLPLLQKQKDAAIINVSSVAAFVPGLVLTTYAASKAALHSYTRALRLALSGTNVKVFELMPPLVDTEFSAAIGGANGIPAAEVAEELISAMENDTYEIRVAGTEYIYQLYQKSPEEALRAMNQLE